MFTKVVLKNFRSLDRFEIDFCSKRNRPKKMAIIFGENGVGKSNLISAFVLLHELLNTMNVRDIYQRILSMEPIYKDENRNEMFRQDWIRSMRDMQAIINDYRMIDTVENVLAEYDFIIDGHAGKYTVEFGKTEIVHEKLEYIVNQRRGIYFDCCPNAKQVNNSIVTNKSLLADIKSSMKKYWGKHSLLAIIMHECMDKSETYGVDSLSENFEKVLNDFFSLSCCDVSIGSRRWSNIDTDYNIFDQPMEGVLPFTEEKQIDVAQEVFASVFRSINSNVSSVFYERKTGKDGIKYHLFIDKKISGQHRRIDIDRESAGTIQIVQVLCFLLSACMKRVVVLDEADSAIHDVLFQKILQEIEPFINGQLIMTTHNTMLMENSFSQDATYIMSEDAEGYKKAICVSDNDKRIFQKNSIRNKYLHNEYKGLPETKEIDFSALLDLIEKTEMTSA
jgi:AAA15 family ATPase/GTPase